MFDDFKHLQRLISIIKQLRDPKDGCEWTSSRSFADIAPFVVEEAYEVADAIARDHAVDLQDELGDLLLQVVFLSCIAEERALFKFGDVTTSIADKMERRHPGFFPHAAKTPTGTKRDMSAEHAWEIIKAAERTERGLNGVLDGVAPALPAMIRAEKLQKRAAHAGFDWPDTKGAAEKLQEEIAEFTASDTKAAQLEEAGDVLFSVINWLRKHGISSDQAMHAANAKFERRFRMMEAMAAADDINFSDLDAEAQDQLWRRVKQAE
ncbi:nucleoside triphosphate pyrophosphohydrolase [Croceicoccus sp. F390]|uniref:Nucleoside triphosphate pyrophosphohydrolase n=1 Tax=Croceicoccus esteveae TaxID=3075597 RepID=A0ABU2ZJ56_9SPHN|nr:nucleoside triphosphate pyrophosphohydrolase [Croceicoccus sp. F390]MDT0576637.1 nucleoside triphosphate pyrophosphohydrolase [Croceicoccus sp. F390]